MGNAHIILVEDDPHISRLLEHHLTRAGYSVGQAGSLEEARELFRSAPWDLAILDRGLPDGDGLSLCQELRRSAPHGYLLIVTGNASGPAKLEGFNEGADDYVTKPFQIDELMARVRAGVRIVGLQKALLESNRRLEELSLTDALTGVPNRRAFDDRLAEAFEHARRYQRPLSLALADMDRFKVVNDLHGHDAGDAVLRGAASGIARCSRQTDFVARFGGEEFAILLPETALFEAMQFGEKIRSCVAADPLAGFSMTASIGIANIPHSHITTSAELFQAADQALYRAKANGRNRVEMERRRELRESRQRWTGAHVRAS